MTVCSGGIQKQQPMEPFMGLEEMNSDCRAPLRYDPMLEEMELSTKLMGDDKVHRDVGVIPPPSLELHLQRPVEYMVQLTDPMLLEREVSDAGGNTQVQLFEEQGCYEEALPQHTVLVHHIAQVEAESVQHEAGVVSTNTSDSPTSLEGLMTKVITALPQPVLPTPARRVQPARDTEDDERSIRRSGRLAIKQRMTGNKKTEELAQEVLAKKLGDLSPSKDRMNEAKSLLAKLFEEPLPKETLQAMEDLLQAMNIDTKKTVTKADKGAAKKLK